MLILPKNLRRCGNCLFNLLFHLDRNSLKFSSWEAMVNTLERLHAFKPNWFERSPTFDDYIIEVSSSATNNIELGYLGAPTVSITKK